MQWDDIGFLLSKNRFNENSVIAEFYTIKHGKFSGLIFGATSKKIKNFLQIGNKLQLNYNYKVEGKPGYFKIELLEINTPFFFDNKKKLLCINSAMNLIKLLTVESQENIKIFEALDNFFINLNDPQWIKKYIFWELKILELVGYNIDFGKHINHELVNNKKKYFIKSKNTKMYVPNFFIEQNNEKIDNLNYLNGLNLIGEYMNKNILKPNNIVYPSSRSDFTNLFK
tara:strand:- start:563 stop:1243 length:681 start_codon:yes stop_codon:yes gene_type:complete